MSARGDEVVDLHPGAAAFGYGPPSSRATPAAASIGWKMGKARKVKPLLWTVARVERWRESGQAPGRVLVWGRDDCGAFLDGVEHDRMYPLFAMAAYYGLRRSELCGLC